MRRIPLTLLLGLFAAPAYAQDSDGDGVADVADVFPCDASLASVVHLPSSTQWTLLAFEDQWPSWTDLDYNDVVVRTQVRVHRDAAGRAVRVLLVYDPVALGGDYVNGLGVQLPAPRTDATARRRIAGGPWAPLSPQADANLTLRVSDDLRELFGGATGAINSKPGSAYVQGQRLEVEIVFATPVALDTGLAPFDVFVFRSADYAHQIHFPEYAGTAAMNASLFNTENDASTASRRFVHKNGTPFALNLQGTDRYPLEGVAIQTLFPDITTFAASGGATNRDFYATRVVATNGYQVAPRPAPTVDPADVSCTYRWTTSSWGACGGGTGSWQYGSWGACEGGLGEWLYGGWGACSASSVCSGAGTQTRSATCNITPGSGIQRRNSTCVWDPGSGSQARDVTCVDRFGAAVEDGLCAANKPAASQACDMTGSASGACLVAADDRQSCDPVGETACGGGTTSRGCTSPAGTRGCAIANGAGQQSCAQGGTSWTACTLTGCNSGFHAEGNSCVSNTRGCTVSNGSGQQAWTGSSWGACTVTSCNSGFHAEGNSCVSNTRSCAVANGSGQQAWTGSSWGACQVTSCNSGYYPSGNTCAAYSYSWSTGGWGSCTGGSATQVYGSWGSCTGGSGSWSYGSWGSCSGATASPSYGSWGSCTGGTGSWSYGSWSACSKTAVCSGVGTQTRSATCNKVSNSGSQSRSATCVWNSGSGAQSRSATCSITSGSGTQTRSGSCAWSSNSGSRSRSVVCQNNLGQTVPDSYCTGTKPATTTSCTPSGTPSSCGTLTTSRSCTPTSNSVCGAVGTTSRSCTPSSTPSSCGSLSTSRACTPTSDGVCGSATTSRSCNSPAGSRSCSITNGTGSQSCSAGSTSWGTCTVTGCNSGYTQSGNSCVSANPCQTGPFQRVPGCSCGTRRDCEGFDTYTNRGTYCEVKRVGCLCVTANQYCP